MRLLVLIFLVCCSGRPGDGPKPTTSDEPQQRTASPTPAPPPIDHGAEVDGTADLALRAQLEAAIRVEHAKLEALVARKDVPWSELVAHLERRGARVPAATTPEEQELARQILAETATRALPETPKVIRILVRGDRALWVDDRSDGDKVELAWIKLARRGSGWQVGRQGFITRDRGSSGPDPISEMLRTIDELPSP